MLTNQMIDVRPILAAGDCPFDTVLEAAKTLQQGDSLTLTAPFNPVPLQQALAGIGIDFVGAEQDDDGAFTVEFVFTPLGKRRLHEDVDLTDLEPPQADDEDRGISRAGASGTNLWIPHPV